MKRRRRRRRRRKRRRRIYQGTYQTNHRRTRMMTSLAERKNCKKGCPALPTVVMAFPNTVQQITRPVIKSSTQLSYKGENNTEQEQQIWAGIQDPVFGAIPVTDLQFRFHINDRLVDLVVKASASRAEDPGFESCLRRGFFRVESYR